MKVIRLHEPGEADALRYEDVPDLMPGADQVLIRIEAIGVNFVDVYHRRGEFHRASVLPMTPGIEAAGRATAVGSNVRDVPIGARVGYTSVVGAYAEYAVVPAAKVVVLPDDIAFTQAAALLSQGITAHYLACTTYPLKAGDTCLVHAAAGGVGTLLCQIAKLRGATVIGTVSTDEKATVIKANGVEHAIVSTRQDFEAEVKAISSGRGIQVVYDGVGRATFEKGLNVLARRGMMVLYGQTSGKVAPIDHTLLNTKGSLFMTCPTVADYVSTRSEMAERTDELFGWIRDGRLKLKIAGTYPLKDAADAHRALESRKTSGKVLLTP